MEFCFSLQFVNDGGFNSGMSGISGVPTRTTSTLTPTTLRNIEQVGRRATQTSTETNDLSSPQTFQDLSNDLSQSSPYSAGFVPPPAPTNQLTVLPNSNSNTLPPYQPPMRQQQHQQANIPAFINEMDPNSMESMDSSSMSDSGSWHTPPPTVMDEMNGNKRSRSSYASPGSSSSNSNQKPARRNAGGRKPNKVMNVSPEEEEKRRVRRERNKQAAARCRRRREDHTSELQGQVDELEDKKRQFTAEIQAMNQLRDELYQLIDEHKKLNHCVIGDRQSPPDVKPVVSMPMHVPHVPITVSAPSVPLQRPTNFVTSIASNNNNNNTMNANKLALKIKAEPLDEFYDDDEPPRKKKCDM
jgi:fos-like antigen, invertebrate